MFFRKKAVLLIHGFVGGIYDYGNFQNELQVNRKFDVYTFTLPGHEKHIVKGVKYEEWIKEAERQIEFLINHHYKEIYVVGHSMGGVIAAHLASKYKEVKKLVLAAPAFRYFYFKEGKVNIRGINDTVKGMPSLIRDEGRDKVIERIQKTPLATMIEFTKLVNTLSKDLSKITCPVLIIHGLNDHVVPTEGTEYAYNNIKSKTNILVNIKDVTHDCFVKKRKEEVKSIIASFLIKYQKRRKEIINI